MKKLIVIFALSLSLLLCLTACGTKMLYDLTGTASTDPDDRNSRPYAPYIGDDVTQAEAMHVCAGQVKEWTVTGDELDALREWANALDYKHTTFGEGESPAEGEGAELYSFTLTEGDYPGFAYYHGERAYLNIEGEWFAVTSPSRPPVDGLE